MPERICPTCGGSHSPSVHRNIQPDQTVAPDLRPDDSLVRSESGDGVQEQRTRETEERQRRRQVDSAASRPGAAGQAGDVDRPAEASGPSRADVAALIDAYLFGGEEGAPSRAVLLPHYQGL